MVTIYSIRNGVVSTTTDLSEANVKTIRDVWVDVQSPTDTELEQLKHIVEIPPEVLNDVQDANEVPKLDHADSSLYILLQTPAAATNTHRLPSQLEYAIAPLGILLNERMLVTVSWGSNDVVDYLVGKLDNIANNRIVDTSKPSQIAVKFFLFTAKVYLRYLKEIYHRLQVPVAEHDIGEFDKDIAGLLRIEQSLVYFDTALRSNQIVAERISRRKQFTKSEYDRELMEDVQHEIRQAVGTVQIYGHIVEDIRNALSSLISNNLTRTVNWLTKITVILMLPTLVGTLYGMNVPLPFAHSPFAFVIVVGFSIAAMLLGIWWLGKSRQQ